MSNYAAFCFVFTPDFPSCSKVSNKVVPVWGQAISVADCMSAALARCPSNHTLGLQKCCLIRSKFTVQFVASLPSCRLQLAISRLALSTFIFHDGSSAFAPNKSAICFSATSHPMLASFHNVSCWVVFRRNCAVHALSSRNFQQRSRSHLSINVHSMRCWYLPIPHRCFIICKLQKLSFRIVFNGQCFSMHPLP